MGAEGRGVRVGYIRACALKWRVGGTTRQDATGPSVGPSPLVLLGPLGSEGATERGCRLSPSLRAHLSADGWNLPTLQACRAAR